MHNWELMAGARSTVLLETNPAISLSLISQIFSYREEAVQHRFIDALRIAGLPE
jgi:hypothetical protein